MIWAVIKRGGTVGLLRHLVRSDYVLVFSRPILVEPPEQLELAEIKERYGVTADNVAALTALFIQRGAFVTPNRQVSVCRDPEDNTVIEAAWFETLNRQAPVRAAGPLFTRQGL